MKAPSICIFQFAFFILHFFLFFVSSAQAQVQLPDFDAAAPISVTAQAGNRWQAGSYEVWVLRGDCLIQQGEGTARCREAVLWIDRAAPPSSDRTR